MDRIAELSLEQRSALLDEIERRVYGRYDIGAAAALQLLRDFGPLLELYRQLQDGCGVVLAAAELENAARELSRGAARDASLLQAEVAELRALVRSPMRLPACFGRLLGPPEWLANHLGVPNQRVEAWRSGEASPSAAELELIAEFCGETATFLAGETDDCRALGEQEHYLDETLIVLRACQALTTG